MNIDIEELVCFVYQQVNKVASSLTVNNFDQNLIQSFEKETPNLLIEFFLQDQKMYLMRRTALDMQTNLMCAKCEYASKIWYRNDVDADSKKQKFNDVRRSLSFLQIKSAVQIHEKQMQDSLSATFCDEVQQTKKSKL